MKKKSILMIALLLVLFTFTACGPYNNDVEPNGTSNGIGNGTNNA